MIQQIIDYKYREQLFGAGLTKGQKVNKAFLGGVSVGFYGMAYSMALVGFQAKRTGRGGFVSAVVGQAAAGAVGIPLAGFASAAVACIPGIGPVTAVIIGSVLADYGEYRIGSSMVKAVRHFTDTAKRVRHLEMGGSYQDSELSQRQRFYAIQDMNGARTPSRRYLGQEALLMHR